MFVHGVLLVALLSARVRVVERAQPDVGAITLFALIEPRERPREPRAETPARAATRSPDAGAAVEPPPPRAFPQESAAITIDWAREAARSAERQIAAADEADRRAAAFVERARAGAIELDTAPPPEPEFGWSEMAKGRIHRTETGGTVLRLSERCIIVLSALMPLCQLGKAKVNGELFEHMDDPPEMGDWKD